MTTYHGMPLATFKCVVLSVTCAGCAAAHMAREELPATPTTSGGVTELIRVTTSTMNEYGARPSRDGRYILTVQRDETRGRSADALSIARTLVGSPGSSPLTDRGAYDPAWHPDGETFYYVSARTGQPRLVRSKVTGASAMTFVLSSVAGGGEVQPDVHPQGRKIALSVRMQNTNTIAVVEINGSDLTVYGPGQTPRWSPNGAQIAFTRTVGRHAQVFVMQVDNGSHVTQLTSGDYDNSLPVWSPDGQWLAFTSSRDAGSENVFIMRADGTVQTQLTSGATADNTNAWTSEGLYFSSNAGGRVGIWRVKVNLPG
jgi:Tol biopolymer transport system component